MRFIVIVVCFLFAFGNSNAQKTWIATSSPAYWNDPVNWLGGVPGTSDAVVFNNSSTINCELNVVPTIASITINGYTGTIDLKGNNLRIISAGAVTSTFRTGTITNSSTAATLIVDAIISQATFSGTLFQANVNVDVKAGDLYLNGSTFNGTCSFIKYARTVNTSNGGNVFNGPTTIGVNNDTGLEMNLTSSSSDVFNNSITFVGASASNLRIGYGAGCTFNGNVIVSNPSGLDNLASGITFGNGSSSGGSSVMTNGTFTLTTPYNGVLTIENFTQTGTGAVTMTMSASTGRLIMYNSDFKGNFSAEARRMELFNSAFRGSTNSFTSKATIALIHSSTNNCTYGTAGVAGTTTFNKTTNNNSNFTVESGGGIGTFYHNVILKYSGGGTTPRTLNGGYLSCYADLSWDQNSTGTLGLGTVWFSGSANQSVNLIAGQAAFGAVTLQKTGTGNVTLNTPMICSGDVKFTNGIIISSATNYAQMNSCSGPPKNASHVDGPVQKVGNTAFTFPTGNSGMYGPIQITAPSASSTFVARFISSSARSMDPDLGTGIVAVSDCEYWTLDRPVGSGSVDVGLSWGAPSSSRCIVGNLNELRVAQYDGAQWVDKGNNTSAISGGTSAGSIRSGAGMVTAFSPNVFALSSSTMNNPLPVTFTFLETKVSEGTVKLAWQTATEIDNQYFKIQRSTTGKEFEDIGTIAGAGTGATNEARNYSFTDRTPEVGKNYYRIKQVDFDRNISYSSVEFVMVEAPSELTVFPNPVRRGVEIMLNQNRNFTVANQAGQILLQVNATNRIDTSSLQPGIYIVRSDSGESTRITIE